MSAVDSRRPVIGVTGPPGSGKTTAAAALADLGAVVVALDGIGHRLLLDPEVREALVRRFGEGILRGPGGEVAREVLGSIAFDDPRALAALNAIMHPRMTAYVREQVSAWRSRTLAPEAKALVIEGALVMEMGLETLCDHVLLVTAPPETRLARLGSTRGWSRAELDKRERAQLCEESRRARAEAVLENASEIDDMRARLKDLWREWI